MTIAGMCVLVIGAVGIVHARPQIKDENFNIKTLFVLSRNNSELWQIPLSKDEGSQTLLSKFVADYDVDYIRNRVHFISDSFIYTKSINNRNLLIENTFYNQLNRNLGKDARIAYDLVNDKYYVISGQSREIDVFGSDDKERTILFKWNPYMDYEDHGFIKKILLDSEARLMFFLTELDWENNIYVSNMDGTSKKLLISNVGSDQFDIDCVNNRLYWFDAKQNEISSADYEGNNIVSTLKIDNQVAFTVDENVIYWWDTHTDKLFSIPKHKSYFNFCKLIDSKCNPCSKHSIYQYIIRDVKSIKVVTTSYGQKNFVNPCELKNCQHQCLLTTSLDGSNCVCYEGWQTSKEDPEICQPVKKHFSTRSSRLKKRYIPWDMYSQQPTLRPDPQMPQQPSHIPIYIFYPGK